jgi:hypothetical protein
MMPTLTRQSTTEMEVTSIRLERDLKEELKKIAGNRGYQALIRDVLWEYVQLKQQQQSPSDHLTAADIRATLPATAQQLEYCTLTGKPIQPKQKMLLGFTCAHQLVPLSLGSLDN